MSDNHQKQEPGVPGMGQMRAVAGGGKSRWLSGSCSGGPKLRGNTTTTHFGGHSALQRRGFCCTSS
jgi:hypothetical protein